MRLIPMSIGSFLRLLVGVVMVQGITALVVLVALSGDWSVTWPLFVALGLTVGVMATFWFNAIVGDHRRQMAEVLAERYAKERETMRRSTQRETTRKIRETEARTRAEARREQARSWRSGLGFGGAAALGLMLMLGQMMVIGGLVLGTTGVGVVAWRLRKARVAARLASPDDKPMIEA